MNFGGRNSESVLTLKFAMKLLLFLLLQITSAHQANIVERFHKIVRDHDFRLLPLDISWVPIRVQDRLSSHGLIWDNLPGLLQRAVLWDTGFILNSANEPVPIYGLCGDEETDNIDVHPEPYLEACSTAQLCGDSLRSLHCNGDALSRIARCAIDDRLFLSTIETSVSSMWAEWDQDSNYVPNPIVYSHFNTEQRIYGLHFDNEQVHLGQCPSHAEIIIPCVALSSNVDGKWCQPLGTPAMNRWLSDFRQTGLVAFNSSPANISNTSSSSATIISIVAGIVAAMAAALAFVLYKRKNPTSEVPDDDDVVLTPRDHSEVV